MLDERRPPVQVRGRGWLRFLLAYAVLWGTLARLGAVDATGRWGLLILVAVAVMAVVVDRLLFRTSLRSTVRSLGLGRPGVGAVLLAAVVSGLVLLVYPATRVLTGAQFGLVDDWAWIALGLFAFHGLAEELVWRGFVFRRLYDGRSFWAAVVWSMPFLAVSHLPMLFTNGVAVAVGALSVAAVTSIPLSALYVAGRRTIWAPGLLHAAIDSFKLVTVPPAAAPSFSLLLIAFSLVVPLLVLVFPHSRSTRGTDTTRRD